MLVGYVCMSNQVESHFACKDHRTRIFPATASQVKYEHQQKLAKSLSTSSVYTQLAKSY